MIAADQPTCFPDNVRVFVSSKDDGTMLDKAMGIHDGETVSNRTRFCDAIGVSYGDAVYQRIIYDGARTYTLVGEVDKGSTTSYTSEVVADALYTTAHSISLMLPVADCVATVIYDPIRRALAVAHLGRHSSYAKLASRVVAHFIADGSEAADLIVWMSPHVQKSSYRLDWFDREDDADWRGFYEVREDGTYLHLAGFNRHLLEQAGVNLERITVSPVDTATDSNYFSHSQGDTSGRIVVVASITA